MNWLCDSCGYENEFNEESQPTECLCCGESAPEWKILQLRQELEAYHREERQKARLEEQKRRRELRQQQIARIIHNTMLVVKAAPAVLAISFAAASCWVIFSLHASDITLSSWNQQMQSNVVNLCLKGAVFSPVSAGTRRIASQHSAGCSSFLTNITPKRPESLKRYGTSVGALAESIRIRQTIFLQNALQIPKSAAGSLYAVGKQAREVLQNHLDSLLHLGTNFLAFGQRAAGNVTGLIYKFT